MKEILEVTYNTIWSLPFILALLSVGLYFSFKLKLVQLKCIGEAFNYIMKPQKSQKNKVGDISNFGSLCTALSATLGTGNIVGIAVAVSIGGPGTLFWLMLSSFFSLATKYCEGFLAIRYRQIGSDGKIAGGPMYYIEKGLNNKLLAKLFALSGVTMIMASSLVQTKSIADAVSHIGIQHCVSAAILGIIVAIVIIGGIKRIAEFAEKVVPLMTMSYLGIAIVILALKVDMILPALRLIVTDAFSPQAVVGGGFGAALMHSIKTGICRGIYCHEAGLGSAAIASAAAKVNNAREQGLISMAGAFMSIVVCMITGLILVVTSNDTHIASTACTIPATSLTAYAFGSGLGILSLGYHIVNISVILFAFTTVIGNNYYGEKCTQYLISTKAISSYKILYILFVVIGPFLNIESVFIIADISTGLMAIPNILSLIMLRNEITD